MLNLLSLEIFCQPHGKSSARCSISCLSDVCQKRVVFSRNWKLQMCFEISMTVLELCSLSPKVSTAWAATSKSTCFFAFCPKQKCFVWYYVTKIYRDMASKMKMEEEVSCFYIFKIALTVTRDFDWGEGVCESYKVYVRIFFRAAGEQAWKWSNRCLFL